MATKRKKIDVIESRCDRCGALFTREHVDRKTGEIIERERSPFGLRPLDGVTVMMGSKCLIYYEHLCRNCSGHVLTLVKKLVRIDRTRGGNRKKK